MNRRYTIIDSIHIKATKDMQTKEFDVPCSFRPDSRDNVGGETAVVTFTGPADTEDAELASSIQLSTNFNFNNGTITNKQLYC